MILSKQKVRVSAQKTINAFLKKCSQENGLLKVPNGNLITDTLKSKVNSQNEFANGSLVTGSAQGTIEYLIILAIIIVLALVVVSFVGGFGNNLSGMSESQSKTMWAASSPFSIIDWSLDTDGNVTLVFRNNSSRTLAFNSVTLGSEDYINTDVTSNIAPGATFTKIIQTQHSCNSGDKISYSPSGVGITLDYNTTYIQNQVQTGLKEIVITCS